jgi:hypothetical protein
MSEEEAKGEYEEVQKSLSKRETADLEYNVRLLLLKLMKNTKNDYLVRLLIIDVYIKTLEIFINSIFWILGLFLTDT